MTIIPRRDPEIVKAEAEQRYCGNDEKVATTTIDHLTVHGVDITSRYNKALEFEVMAKLVEVLPAFVRDRIASIWCYNVLLLQHHVAALRCRRSGSGRQVPERCTDRPR